MWPSRSWSSAVIRRWSEWYGRTVVSRTVLARNISTIVSNDEKVADHAPSKAAADTGTRNHPPKGTKHKTSAVQVRRNLVEKATDGLPKSRSTSDNAASALPRPESIFKTYTLTKNGVPEKAGHQKLLASRAPLLCPSPVRDFSLLPMKIVRGRLNKLQEDAVNDFKAAFTSEVPLLMRPPQGSADNGKPDIGIPALQAGFDHYYFKASGDSRYKLWSPYWTRFGHVHVPYELVRIAANSDSRKETPGSLAHFRAYLETKEGGHELAELMPEWTNKNQITRADWKPSDLEFHHFRAPLMLFIHAAEYGKNAGVFDGFPWMPKLLGLYVAQAQLAELPYQLQKGFPPPRIILEAGKGDIYDANIWLGTPPTYTPLHKDPNPNLFVQLAGSKMVRLLSPPIGGRVFRDVQAEIGTSGSATFRGEEMMQGPERELLEKAVWGSELKDYVRDNCREILVKPGDALFIPKGWWHSFKSLGPTVTASVNWWFR